MPLLSDMAVGAAATLSSDQQRLIATWAYKTALVLDLVRPVSRRIDASGRYAELYADRRPALDVGVWLGATADGPAAHHTATHAMLTTLNSALPGYISALTLGSLLVIVAGRLEHDPYPFRVAARGLGTVLVAVWPASISARDWPPPVVTTDVSLEHLVSLI